MKRKGVFSIIMTLTVYIVKMPGELDVLLCRIHDLYVYNVFLVMVMRYSGEAPRGG